MTIQLLHKKLIQKKLTISLAESCTGGLLSSAITSVNGSSEVFTMGLVTYSNQAKTKVLKIPKKIIKIVLSTLVFCFCFTNSISGLYYFWKI